MPKSLAVN